MEKDNQIDPKPDYKKISHTAYLVAFLKTFGSVPFAEETGRLSGCEEFMQKTNPEGYKHMLQLAPMFEARYHVITDNLRNRGIEQVLETAVGVSPRGIDMTADPKIDYLATDLPDMLIEQERISKAILASHGYERPNLRFMPVDVLNRAQMKEAIKSFDQNKPLGVISEGLFLVSSTCLGDL